MQQPSNPYLQYPQQQWQTPSQPLPLQQWQPQPSQGQWQLLSQPMPPLPLQPQYPYYERPEPQYASPPVLPLAPKKHKLLKNKRFRIHYFYVVLIISIVSGFINYYFAAVAIFGFLLGLL